MAVTLAFPYPQGPPGGLPPLPKQGPNGYDTKNYFQYTNVAAPKVFEWGYSRGNAPQHFREEYLSQKDHTFKAKLRWGDAYEGQGEQFYDFNHFPGKYEEPVGYKPAPVKVPVYGPA